MIKGPIQQEVKMIINIYVPTEALKYIKQTLLDTKGEQGSKLN